MNKIRQYTSGFNPKEVVFNSYDELMDIDFIKEDSYEDDFYQFSLSENLLMVEYDKGKRFYVVGIFENNNYLEMLPKWDETLSHKLKVIERWEPLVKKVQDLDENQTYILSQLLENLQRDYGDKNDNTFMTIFVSATCQIFESIKDILPETYPMHEQPICCVISSIDNPIVKVQSYKLNTNEMDMESFDDICINCHCSPQSYDAELAYHIVNTISEEIKEIVTKNEIYYPYMLVCPSDGTQDITQLYTIYGNII